MIAQPLPGEFPGDRAGRETQEEPGGLLVELKRQSCEFKARICEQKDAQREHQTSVEGSP